MKGWRNTYANRCQKKASKIAILIISDKTVFKTKSVKRDKEGYYIIIKKTIHQEGQVEKETLKETSWLRREATYQVQGRPSELSFQEAPGEERR